MKNIKAYDGDCFKFHTDIIDSKYENKKDTKYKERVNLLNTDIQKAFSEYEIAFKNNSLETMLAIGYSNQDKDDLLGLYSFQKTDFQNLLRKITTTSHNRKRSICVNCTISEINSFDHYLPQDEFSEFIVNPLNLIPSCTNCNSRKGKIWKANGKKLFLNTYIDLLPHSQFLFAKIDVKGLLEIDVQFLLHQPADISNALFTLIQSHYKKLNLFTRFLNNIDYVISELENDIEPYLNKLPKPDITACVNDTIDRNKVLYGINYWKCVLQEALLNDEKFMSRFKFSS